MAQEGITQSMLARNEIDEVERILSLSNTAVNVTFVGGFTPLHIACSNGLVDLVCLLLQHGANINARDDKYSRTPLHVAHEHLEICKILLQYGADINLVNNNGLTSFHYLARLVVEPKNEAQQKDLLDEFIKKGQDINVQTHTGETALHLACLEGNICVTEFLLQKGADVTFATQYGENPLHYACRRGEERIVFLLLTAGADPDSIGGLGSPLDIAMQGHRKQVVDIIKHYSQRQNKKLLSTTSTNFIDTQIESSVSLGEMKIAPTTRKLLNVKSIQLRNIGVTKLHNYYFTIHTLEEKEKVLFRSQTEWNTCQPSWYVFKFIKEIEFMRSFHFRVWQESFGQASDSCLYSVDVTLSTFSFVGDLQAVTIAMKFLLVVELQDGLYVQGSKAKQYGLTKQAPRTNIPPKPSYSQGQLIKIISLSKEIAIAENNSDQLKNKIADMLPEAIERRKKEMKKRVLQQKIALLKKETAAKRKRLEENRILIENNKNAMKERLKFMSNALTMIMVEEQILEQNREVLLKENEKINEVNTQCNARRGHFVQRLSTIYPITQSKTPNAPACFMIARAPLPNTIAHFYYHNDTHISTALGFVCHTVHLLSLWLDIPLRYPVHLCGSRCSISDPISDLTTNNRFPLFLIRGIEKTRFEYGLYLLNVNIQQMLHHKGIEASLRDTLPNLQILMATMRKEYVLYAQHKLNSNEK